MYICSRFVTKMEWGLFFIYIKYSSYAVGYKKNEIKQIANYGTNVCTLDYRIAIGLRLLI